MTDLKKPDDHGFWDGEYFVFHEPTELCGALTGKVLVPASALGPGMTRDDVISALLNPVSASEADPPCSG